jgi:hypothetical protein
MWDYVCPKCKREVKQKSRKCPYCGENYGLPLRVPPKVLKDKKALEEYVHKHVFPKVSAKQREYLTQFFTTIFSDGFESGDFSAWTGTVGSPAIVTSPVHHGAYAASHYLGGAGTDNYAYKTLTSSYSHIFVRFYWRVTQLPTTLYGVYTLVRLKDSGGTERAHLNIYKFSNVPEYQWQFKIEGTEVYALQTDLLANQWYCVEIEFYSGASHFWLDGNLKLTNTASSTNTIQTIEVGGISPSYYGGGTGYDDCVVVADTYIGPEAAVVPVGGTVQQAKLQDII